MQQHRHGHVVRQVRHEGGRLGELGGRGSIAVSPGGTCASARNGLLSDEIIPRHRHRVLENQVQRAPRREFRHRLRQPTGQARIDLDRRGAAAVLQQPEGQRPSRADLDRVVLGRQVGGGDCGRCSGRGRSSAELFVGCRSSSASRCTRPAAGGRLSRAAPATRTRGQAPALRAWTFSARRSAARGSPGLRSARTGTAVGGSGELRATGVAVAGVDVPVAARLALRQRVPHGTVGHGRTAPSGSWRIVVTVGASFSSSFSTSRDSSWPSRDRTLTCISLVPAAPWVSTMRSSS